MTSLPKRAKLHNIIQDLFQNEVIEGERFKEYYTFSDLHLTDEQQKILSYPLDFIPMNIFVLQQVDSWIGQNFKSRQSIVSFVGKNDGFIYGYYFNIGDNSSDKDSYFDRKVLIKSSAPIKLDPETKFQPVKLLEVYNIVNSLTQILSLGLSVNGSDSVYATLQYSKNHMYYYEVLGSSGINQSNGTRD